MHGGAITRRLRAVGQNVSAQHRRLSLWVLSLTLPAHAGCSEVHSPEQAWLSTQGLYADMASKQVVPEALEYLPDYPLWSDGVQKRRWLLLPKGAVIDTTDMDHWDFPVGTKLFKEFSQRGQLLETRLVERIATTGRFERDFKLATYVWQRDQVDALETPDGVPNTLGTDHNVPAQKLCRECHRGEPSGVLGFSALQLSGSGVLDELAQRGLLSEDPERTFAFPGDDVAAAAAGYLHANCGHCHSATGQAPGDMHLRFSVDEVDQPIEASELYATTLGQRLTEWKKRPDWMVYRILPGDPDHSAVYFRMTQRGDEAPSPSQMPPLATERQHRAALALIRAWIASMSPELASLQEEVTSKASASDLERDAGPSGAAADAEPRVDEMDAGIR